MSTDTNNGITRFNLCDFSVNLSAADKKTYLLFDERLYNKPLFFR